MPWKRASITPVGSVITSLIIFAVSAYPWSLALWAAARWRVFKSVSFEDFLGKSVPSPVVGSKNMTGLLALCMKNFNKNRTI
jgi:hypothetical protein